MPKKLFGRNKKSAEKQVVVAVCGIEPGVGVTEMAVALAAMASSGRWKKIVLLELGDQYSLEKIRRFYKAEILDVNGCFQLDRMTCIPHATPKDISRYAGQDDTFIVLDCGCKWEEYEECLTFCTRKFLLCSLLPWKVTYVEWMLQEVLRHIMWDSILVTYGKKQQKRIRNHTGMKIHPFNPIEDPFNLSAKTVRELYELSCGTKYITRER